jgi:2-methylisocitrate lyase-like PEP mutase family enzyme
MTTPPQTARFRELHRPGDPLIMPNPWDVGSARALASLGFAALATTSSGFAATLGRKDMQVTRREALSHAAALAAAVDVPVSADLENGFGRDPAEVTRTVAGAVAAGLAGCSIEDNDPDTPSTVYDIGLATERIAAAVEAAHGQLVLTARAENFIRGHADVDDTVARLQRYADAGADVLMVPGLTGVEDIKAVIGAVDRPVSLILSPRGPDVPGLAALGVSRITVGGSFAWAAYGALAGAAQQLQTGAGPYPFFDLVRAGNQLIRQAFTDPPAEG